MIDTSARYGPNTPQIRRFLVRLAALGSTQQEQVVREHAILSRSTAWNRAELELASVIAESGRTDAQDALSGPLLQLVRLDDQDSKSSLELAPIAEPALAALLALLISDLLPAETVRTLYEPFSAVIPQSALA